MLGDFGENGSRFSVVVWLTHAKWLPIEAFDDFRFEGFIGVLIIFTTCLVKITFVIGML